MTVLAGFVVDMGDKQQADRERALEGIAYWILAGYAVDLGGMERWRLLDGPVKPTHPQCSSRAWLGRGHMPIAVYSAITISPDPAVLIPKST
jgi:hypothetical protein